MEPTASIGDDHSRVTKPKDTDDPAVHFEYCRHFFPYREVAGRARPGARVLEVGFGAGYGAEYMAHRGLEVVATDISWEAAAHARATTCPGARICLASGTALPFASAAFDLAASFQVIEHIEDVDAYLRELGRVLKPGGELYLTTPNRRLRLLPFQKPWNPYHVREYSDRDLRAHLRARFPEVTLQGIFSLPHLMAFEVARVRQSPLRLALKAVYARIRPRLPRAVVETLRGLNRRAWQPPVLRGSVDVGDFFLSGDTRSCLDLFAVSRKP